MAELLELNICLSGAASNSAAFGGAINQIPNSLAVGDIIVSNKGFQTQAIPVVIDTINTVTPIGAGLFFAYLYLLQYWAF